MKHGVSGPGKAENPKTQEVEIKDPEGDMSKNKGMLCSRAYRKGNAAQTQPSLFIKEQPYLRKSGHTCSLPGSLALADVPAPGVEA